MKINERALALQTADKTVADARYRMNFGIFNYNQEYTEPETGNLSDNDDKATAS
jgi:hypothetical protein